MNKCFFLKGKSMTLHNAVDVLNDAELSILN